MPLFVVLVLILLGLGQADASSPDTDSRKAPAQLSAADPNDPTNRPSVVTDASGTFEFKNLDRGTHQVYLDLATLPAELYPSNPQETAVLWLNPGQSLVSDVIGAGVRLSAHYDIDGTSINGVVFLDQDRDGQHDPTEPGLAGVTVIDPTLHQYFVPFEADELHLLFAEIYNEEASGGQCLRTANLSISEEMESVISVTSSSNGTIILYDHWEDGYDADPLTPGRTTEVHLLDAGLTKTFNDVIFTPRDSSVIAYDGRDRISVFGEPASVVRAVSPAFPGVVLAGAWEMPEVSNWGRNFVAVIGEDIQINASPTPNDFDYVGLQVMAAFPNTQVYINGTNVATLGVGETYLIDGENNGPGNGGVDSSDVITATGPVQVQILGAACEYRHSARAYTLQPRDIWSQEYWAPVPDFADDGVWCTVDDFSNPDFTGNDRDTDIYIHNPHPFTITVDLETTTTIASFDLPPTTTISSLANVPAAEWNSATGVHLTSNYDLWGVSAIDSVSGDAWPDSSASNHSDWGYSLIPVSNLSSQVVMGWSPGNGLDLPTGDVNGSLAFVSALADTIVYVDLNDDGLPSDYTDFVVDSLRATEPPAIAFTDYLSYTWGYTPVANAQGVDPEVFAFRIGWDSIGPGQTITITLRVRIHDQLPISVTDFVNLAVFGSSTTTTDQAVGQPILQIDKVGDPDPVRPGDTITYTIVATNTGSGTAVDSVLWDDLPPYVTYVPDTLDLTLPYTVAEVITRSVPYTTSFRGNYADDFDLSITQTSGYIGSDGILFWAPPWIEVGDDGSPDTGEIQVGSGGGALSMPGYLLLTNSESDGADASLTREVDLTDFVAPRLSYYVSGNSDEADDSYTILADGTTIFTEQYDGGYERRLLEGLEDLAGSIVTLEFRPDTGMEAGDFYRFDNILIFESSSARTNTRVLTRTNTLISYTTQTNINPVSYDPLTNRMQITDNIAIPPSANVLFSFQVQVAIPLTNTWQLLNTAAITSSNVITTPFPLEDTEETTVLSSHALTITKTADTDPVFIGQQLTYDLFWEVGGDEPAPGLVITDTIPYPYVSFVSCEGPLSCNFIAPDTVIWQLGDHLPVASGILYASGHVTLTVRAEQYPPGDTFTNVAVLDDETDTDPDRNEETTNVLDAGFTLTKRRISPSPVAVGKNVSFTIVITNTGAVTITRLPLEDTYDPTYLAFQEALPAPDATEPGWLSWDDLTPQLLNNVLLPDQSTQVLVVFTALTTTQHLSPPVTINTAISAGAETPTDVLPPVEDQDDVEIEPSDPDAIELVYFRATPRGDDILIEWPTLFEIDTYGFWLHRGTDGILDHATAVAFIPAKGWHSLGAAYQYLDTDLPAGEYSYWLVEVENSGTETVYGPVSASPSGNADLPYKIYLPLLKSQ